MKPNPLPLRVWIPCALALMALFLTSVSIAHEWLRWRRTEEGLVQRALNLSDLLASRYKIAVAQNRPDLGTEFSRLKMFPNLRQALIVDEADEIVIANEPALTDQPLRATPVHVATGIVAIARTTMTRQTERNANGSLLRIATPISLVAGPNGDAAVRVLYTEMDLEGVGRTALSETLQRSLLMGLAAALMTVAIWQYFRRTFERRLNQLVSAVDAYADGGDHPLPTEGNDELAVVARAVKKMATEMAAQDATVRASEARLQEAQRVAQVGSWMWEPSGKLSWSAYMHELFGIPATESPTYDRFLQALHPDDRVAAAQGFENWMRSDRRSNRDEYRIVRPDGSVRHVLAVGDVVRGSSNEPRYAVGTVQDITERKLAEKALCNHSARQALLLEVTAAVVAAPQSREELIRVVFEKVSPFLQVDVAFNYELVNGALRLVSGFGIPPELQAASQRLEIGQAFCGTVAETRQPLAADSQRVATDPKGQFVHGMGVRCYMCHPLLSREGRLLGTFSLASRTREVFAPDEIEFLQTLCHFVALAWERVAAEEALRASEDRFRSVVEAAPSAMLMADSTGRITLVNQQLERLFGYIRAELIGQPVELLLPARNRPGHAAQREGFFRAPVQRSMGEGRELFGLRQDGTEVAIEIGLGPINKPEGQFVLAAIVDITERKQAERALRESEARFRELAETISQIFWVSSPDKSQVQYISPAYETIWGRTCESLLTNPRQWLDSIHDEDREQVIQAAQTRQADGTYDEQYRIIRPDGTVRWIHDRAFPVRDASGNVVRIAGVAEDITVSKRAEAERIRLAAFPQLNPNAVLELSDRGKILYANGAATRLAAELGFVEPIEMLPPDIAGLVKICLAGEKSLGQLERTYGQRVVAWSLYPVDGRQVVHCYAEDITERRRLEEQVRQSQKMEALGQLAGGVAHDFNNILAVFMLQLDLATRLLGPGLAPAVVDSLNELRKSAQRAAALTRQLLLFGRREVMQFSRVDLNDLLDNLAKMLRRIVGEDIEFVLKGPSTPLWIEVDAGMIEQVVVNLCVNARDAMPKGGRLTVESRLCVVDEAHVRTHVDARPGTFACLSVSDTGTGIDPPCYRGSSSRSSRPRKSDAAPASAWLRFQVSSNSIKAGSKSKRPPARGRPSASICRWRSAGPRLRLRPNR